MRHRGDRSQVPSSSLGLERWHGVFLLDGIFVLSRIVMAVPLFLLSSSCYHPLASKISFSSSFTYIFPPRSLSFWPLGREVYIVRDTRKWHAVCLWTCWSFLSDVCGAIFSKSTRLVMKSGSRLTRSCISALFDSENIYRCPFADSVSLSRKCPSTNTVTEAIISFEVS